METFKLPVGNFEWIEKDQLNTWTAKDIFLKFFYKFFTIVFFIFFFYERIVLDMPF